MALSTGNFRGNEIRDDADVAVIGGQGNETRRLGLGAGAGAREKPFRVIGKGRVGHEGDRVEEREVPA